MTTTPAPTPATADGLTTENARLRQQVAELEAALSRSQQQEKRLHTMLTMTTDWLWEIDASGAYTYVSPNITTVLGYEPHEVVGKTPFDLMPPAEAERVRSLFGPMAEARQPVTLFEHVSLHKDGHRLVMETSGVPFYDEAGTFCGYRGEDRNISGRKQTEEEMMINQFVLENANDAIEWIAPNGQFLYVNQTGCQHLGYTRDELLSLHVWDIDPNFSREGWGSTWIQLKQADLMTTETSHRRKDGQIFPVEVAARHLEWQGKEWLITFVRDITTRKQEEAERAGLQQQIIDAQRNALRELSTPLIPITDSVLIMPIIGTIDSQRAQQVMETLLMGVAQHQAELVILDITGVSVVDTQVANAFIQSAQAVRLLGAQVMLTGIQPQIAQTMVQLGVNLRGIVTRTTLQAGIAYALSDSRHNGQGLDFLGAT
ncbi:MAG: PAS domain S-box protein [Chloroflexaceae bacterium]|nr:PAS domain S-box protein [Chloroflexaceae bacterium]